MGEGEGGGLCGVAESKQRLHILGGIRYHTHVRYKTIYNDVITV